MAQQKKNNALGRGLQSLISAAMVKSATATSAFGKAKKGAAGKSVVPAGKKGGKTTPKKPAVPAPSVASRAKAKIPVKKSTVPAQKKPATPAKPAQKKPVPVAKKPSPAVKKPAPEKNPVAVPAVAETKRPATPPPSPAEKKPTPPPPPKPAPVPVAAPEQPALPFREIAVENIVPASHQSRRTFEESELQELADSIRSEGLLQPIVVREIEHGKFELIAGERRWRAFQLLKLKKIPASIVKAGDASSAVMTLIENLQRKNLNPIEEAFGLGSLMRDFNLTQEAVAERVGKARSSIANTLRLLSLATEIRGYIASGVLSVGHAKVLLGVEEPAQQLLLARRFVETQCSVRVAEDLAKRVKRGVPAGTPARGNATEPVIREISEEIFRIEKTLCSHFHTKVLLKHGKTSGRILIEYHGNDELARLLECFGIKA